MNNAPTTRETADHAELLRRVLQDAQELSRRGMNPDVRLNADEREAITHMLSEIAALRGEVDRIAGESIWWKGVIGDASHQPSGDVRSIRHMHPAMVKPIYDAHKGTAVADVIAGLIFSLAITQNREQFLVKYANDRATQAERQRDELRKAADAMMPLLALIEDGLWEDCPYPDVQARRIASLRTELANQGAE